MTDTAKIVAFLRARLDDDERIAQAAVRGPWAVHPNGEVYAPGFDREVRYHTSRSTTDHLFVTSDSEGLSASVQPEDAAHIARFDPKRMTAEVESKREILKEHQPTDTDPVVCSTCADQDWVHVRRSQTGNREFGGYPCVTVRLLTLPYADRPGFDPAWKL